MYHLDLQRIFSIPFYSVALILLDVSGGEDPDSHLKRLKPNTHYSKCRYGEEKKATFEMPKYVGRCVYVYSS